MKLIKALHAISADGKSSTEDKLKRLLQLGLDAFDMELGIVSHIKDGVYTVVSAISPEDALQKGDSFELKNTYCRDTLAADGIVAYHDAEKSPGVSHPAYQAFALKSYIGIPYFVNGERYGTVNFSRVDAKERQFDNDELDYIVLLAEWVGTEIAREHQLQAIVEQQKALQHQHLLHLQMSELARVGTWEMNRNTGEISFSDSLVKLFEIPEGDHITFDTMQRVVKHDEDVEILRGLMEKSVEDEAPWSHEFEAVSLGGRQFWVQTQGTVDTSDPDNIRFFGATQDVTHRIQVASELENRRHVAEQALESRSLFLANMSHEIRTPINGIVGMLEALKRTSLTEQQNEFCKLAGESASSLLQIVNDVLDFSKIDAGGLELESIPVNLSRIAEEQYRLFSMPAQKKQLSLTLDTRGTDDLVFLTDPTRIRQIFTNLISNAIKFTDRGEINIKLKAIKQARQQYLVQIMIRDEGIGIAPEHQAAIFSPFRQGDSNTTRRFGGTGLGLSIVSQIAAHMHGGIRVNSKPGEGATFIVALKLNEASGHENETEDAAEILRPADLAGKRVLVVEDNEINQIVVKEQLKEFSVGCDIAGHGAEAIEMVIRSIAGNHPYDLILMDCQMPVMDGYEASKKIRQLGGQAEIVPIIALTANVLVGEREKCLLAGMNDYLTKPVDKEQFTRCLHRYLLA